MKNNETNWDCLEVSASQILDAMDSILSPFGNEVNKMFDLYPTTDYLTVSSINNDSTETARNVKLDINRAYILNTDDKITEKYLRWLVSAKYYAQDFGAPLLVLFIETYKCTIMANPDKFLTDHQAFFDKLANRSKWYYETIQIPISTNGKIYCKLITFFQIEGQTIIAVADRHIIKPANSGKTILLFGKERYYFQAAPSGNTDSLQSLLFTPFFNKLQGKSIHTPEMSELRNKILSKDTGLIGIVDQFEFSNIDNFIQQNCQPAAKRLDFVNYDSFAKSPDINVALPANKLCKMLEGDYVIFYPGDIAALKRPPLACKLQNFNDEIHKHIYAAFMTAHPNHSVAVKNGALCTQKINTFKHSLATLIDPYYGIAAYDNLPITNLLGNTNCLSTTAKKTAQKLIDMFEGRFVMFEYEDLRVLNYGQLRPILGKLKEITDPTIFTQLTTVQNYNHHPVVISSGNAYKDQVSQMLNKYIKDLKPRAKGFDTKSFFGRLGGQHKSASSKLQTAVKLRDLINLNEQSKNGVTFEAIDIAALNDGELKMLLIQCRPLIKAPTFIRLCNPTQKGDVTINTNGEIPVAV